MRKFLNSPKTLDFNLMFRCISLIFLAFAAMEILSYVVHRFVFHGVLWRVHKTHHVAHRKRFEANDWFALFFAALSIGLIFAAEKPLIDSHAFAAGIGIALYGAVYFVAHDLFTHRRFRPFNSRNRILLAIRAAHQRHHQSLAKNGSEPFGLFLFDYKRFFKKSRIKRES